MVHQEVYPMDFFIGGEPDAQDKTRKTARLMDLHKPEHDSSTVLGLVFRLLLGIFDIVLPCDFSCDRVVVRNTD